MFMQIQKVQTTPQHIHQTLNTQNFISKRSKYKIRGISEEITKAHQILKISFINGHNSYYCRVIINQSFNDIVSLIGIQVLFSDMGLLSAVLENLLHIRNEKAATASSWFLKHLVLAVGECTMQQDDFIQIEVRVYLTSFCLIDITVEISALVGTI